MEKVLFFNSVKPDAFQLNESTGFWTDGDSVFCDAIINHLSITRVRTKLLRLGCLPGAHQSPARERQVAFPEQEALTDAHSVAIN